MLSGVTFPSIFGISGDQNILASDGTPFLTPSSGNFAGFAFEDTFLTTTRVIQDLYLSGTSLAGENDGVTALTIQATGASGNVLAQVSVVGLDVAPSFVDTTIFNSISGIEGYNFQVDTFGADNPRFGIDDIRFTSVPEPCSACLLYTSPSPRD